MEPETGNALSGAIDEGIEAADNAGLDEDAKKAREAEKNAVKALWKEYETARQFDRDARAQYAVDRRYAAGTAHLDWAVSANLIGAFIDILTSFLYARNPDVSVKKSPRIENTGTQMEDDFAKTMELTVSSLWTSPSARLKHNVRQMVRSTLSVGIGWIKAIVVSNGTNIPQLQNELNDNRRNIEQMRALMDRLAEQQPDDSAMHEGAEAPAVERAEDPEDEGTAASMSPEQIDVEMQRLMEIESSLSQRLEVAMRKGLAVDFVRAEDMQVSLDVPSLLDYTNAAWVANAIYRPVDQLTTLFPRISESNVSKVKHYYQKRVKELSPLSERVRVTGLADAGVDALEAEQYSAGEASSHGEKEVPFAKVVELWNRHTGHVHTMIDGLDKWAVEPYQPDYPSSRFYPYFMAAFYPVDGARHPQSLAWRLAKLQDEYSACRSGLRLTRQRAIPGTLFNATGVDDVGMRKIEHSQHQEFIGIKPTNPDQPLRDLFTEKPIAIGDMRLFETEMILADMERISGVQEALAQSTQQQKTATEAEFQQQGFASRTTADRDVVEEMLNELSLYTAETSLSALEIKDAQRIAGAKAFWPQGMSIDDLLTMVEIKIEAGTTGKPKSASDRDAWGVVMPLIKQAMLEIRQALLLGDQAMADALIALLQETMSRMGDDTDVSRFIAKPPQMMPGVPGAPGMPGMPGDPTAQGGMPGGAPPGAPGDPAAPELAPPDLVAPELTPPELQPPVV